MAFCAKCGAELGAGATFCGKCGTPQGAAAGGAVAAESAGTGMQENVAGLLCYIVWWVTGLIFYLIDKRPFVRFHAAQAMLTSAAFIVLYILLMVLMGASFLGGWILGVLGFLGYLVLGLGGFILWILLMVKAYQGQRFKLPVVGDFAEKLAARP
jgi:uncharacterized membrane protein